MHLNLILFFSDHLLASSGNRLHLLFNLESFLGPFPNTTPFSVFLKQGLDVHHIEGDMFLSVSLILAYPPLLSEKRVSFIL